VNRKFISLCLIISFIVLAFTACGNKKAEDQNGKSKNVKVASVKKDSIIVESEFAGEVKAAEETGVVPKMPGKVKEVMVKVGDAVKKDDVLFTLDSDDLKAQLAQAEYGVEAARASLQKTRSSAYSQSHIQTQVERDQAKLSFEDASTDYTRYSALFEINAVSQREMEAVKTKLDLAKQRYDSAQKNLDLLEKSSGPESIRIAESQLNQAIAGAELVKTQYGNTTVTAPISGFIAAKNINPGEGVSSAAPAVIISNTTELNAELNIPEKLINKFYNGQKLAITVQSLGSGTFDGEVASISPSIDAATRNFKVKIRFINKTEDIKPGMFAKIKVAVDSRSDVIAVQSQAVFAENGVYYTYVVKDGKSVKTPVKIGLSNNRLIEVTQGLNVDDKLIMEGQSFLADGEAVKILEK